MNKITTIVAKNATSETIAVIGIDLAKNVFAVHGINAAVSRKYAQESASMPSSQEVFAGDVTEATRVFQVLESRAKLFRVNRLLKIFLLWFLIAALPAQGLAAAIKASCGPAHHDVLAAITTSDDHSADGHAAHEQHGSASMHSHGEQQAVDALALTDVSAETPDQKSAYCSACAACCVGAVAPPSAMNWAPAFSNAEFIATLPAPLVTGFIPAGLERPPKHISA